MARRRVTQMFPWLLPLRRWQRRLFFYTKMRFDGCRYADGLSEDLLPCVLFTSSCPMLNDSTGLDMVYQHNKVYNLKLAAATLNGLVIRPGETFSFWHLVRRADRETPYREGLAEVDGRLVPRLGGGVCQLANLLFWVMLHAPLTIVERHGHPVKSFPEPPSDAGAGVDATVSEGWLDLRLRNDTDEPYQITVAFDDDHIIGGVRAQRDPGRIWRVAEENLRYCREAGEVYEQVDIVRLVLDGATGRCLERRLLYQNRCRIGYELPPGTPIEER